MKDAAKILLEYGSLQTYVKTFIDDSALEYLMNVFKDNYQEEVKEALIEDGEDLSDYDPLYDDWDELLTAEKENLIDEGSDLLLDHLPFHGQIVTERRDEVYNIIHEEVKAFIELTGVDIFYG